MSHAGAAAAASEQDDGDPDRQEEDGSHNKKFGNTLNKILKDQLTHEASHSKENKGKKGSHRKNRKKLFVFRTKLEGVSI